MSVRRLTAKLFLAFRRVVAKGVLGYHEVIHNPCEAASDPISHRRIH